MAGQKQPMSLKLLKGAKHMTKAEIEKGLKEEVKAPADNVKAPSYLSKDLKREFKKISCVIYIFLFFAFFSNIL